jgi:phage N-6-adenine-methyltransferase
MSTLTSKTRTRKESGKTGLIPSMAQLLQAGRASYRRIKDQEKGVRRLRKLILTEWLDQAERLWIAAEIHGLKGKHFTVFAHQIGIDRSSAYELLKLHDHRAEVLSRCRKENHYPGWEVCASWFKTDKDDMSEPEPEEPSIRNKGLLTPTWQRFKVGDDEYGTPHALFDHYHRIYKFTCDVASTAKLAKCKKFFTPEQDGLKQVWRGVCWMNPPYHSPDIGAWVRKAYEAAQQGAVVVALLPIFTDTAWFHDYASHAEIEVLRGRLQFANRGDNSYTPFGHGIFVFRKKSARKGKKLTIGLNGHRIGTSSPPELIGRRLDREKVEAAG